MNKLYIKGPRQKRAIEALLKNAITVQDMGPKIGAQNPRQTISELRRQGFEGIIETSRFTVIDQDGRRCRPGKYYIPQDAKPIVENVLREYIAQERSKTLDANKEHDNAKHNRRT